MKLILFNTDMVRAILDGRKTATRRAVKPSHKGAAGFNIVRDGSGSIVGVINYDEDERMYDDYTNPPCRPGDILYVRETWNFGYFEASDAELDNSRWFEPLPLDSDRNNFIGELAGFVYRADFTRAEEYEYGTLDEDNIPLPMPWHPSIHMPKEAARIFLRVTGVRAERLHEIECISTEGITMLPTDPKKDPRYYFIKMWDSTIKPADRERYGWAANPWVWVIAFERCEKPEEG